MDREYARNLDSYVDDHHPDDPYERADTDLFMGILELVGELHEVYYRPGGDVQRVRVDIEVALGKLMAAWNRMLG